MRYLGFYGVNVTAQSGWISLGIGSGSDADAYFAATGGRVRSLLRMPASGVYRRSVSTVPGWEAVLDGWLSAEVLPRVANGTAAGVFLGDELCCHNSSCWAATIDPIAAHLRARLGADALLYENDCVDSVVGASGQPPLERVSVDLNFVSADMYVGYEPGGNGTVEPEAVRRFMTAELYPRMMANQSVFVVPGTFACSNLTYMSLEESSRIVVDKLDGYFEWAKADARVAGINPWHFNYRDHPQHAEPCDMMLGAANMPDVVKKLAEIGKWIISNTTTA